jgi:hypothetical protein
MTKKGSDMEDDVNLEAPLTPEGSPTSEGLPTTSQGEGSGEKVTLREALSKAYDSAAEPAVKPTEGSAALSTAPGSGTSTLPAVVTPSERPIPDRLKGKFAEAWPTLDPKVKEAFHEYESSVGKLAHKYGSSAKNWDDTQRAFAPYEGLVKSQGGNFLSAMTNLFETSRILHTGSPEQKTALLVRMAQAFRIPMPGGEAHQAQGAAVPSPAPSGVSLELLDRLNRLEQTHLTREAQDAYTVRTQVDQDLEAFIGDAANTYVKEPGFLGTMAQLITVGKASGLEDAYTQAAWLHENTREMEIAKITQSRNAPRVGAAQRAKAAAVSVNGNAPGSVKLDPRKLNLRQTLSAAYDGELE